MSSGYSLPSNSPSYSPPEFEPTYSPYSPPDLQSATTAASPWSSASSHNNSNQSNHDSWTLTPLHQPDVNFDPGSGFFDSLPRLSSRASFRVEPSSTPTFERLPPSNPQGRQSPRSPPRRSQYRISRSPDPFDEFFTFTPARSPEPKNSSRASSVVDLTNTSPEMAPATRKRKRGAPSGPAPVSTSRKPSPRESAGRPNPPAGTADVVDLVDVEDETQYEAFKAKQQAELIKQQAQDEAKKPIKLAEFQCIICMDNPTDLTVTHCGMFMPL